MVFSIKFQSLKTENHLIDFNQIQPLRTIKLRERKIRYFELNVFMVNPNPMNANDKHP